MNQYNDDCHEIVKNTFTTGEQAIKLHTHYTAWDQRAGRTIIRACPRDGVDFFYKNVMSGGQKPCEIIQESTKKYPAASGYALSLYLEQNKSKAIACRKNALTVLQGRAIDGPS